jgi:L-arabinokinase
VQIAYYISAHGYGHGVRSCDILAALFARHPGARVTVTTGLPESFLRNRLPEAGERLRVREGVFDVGMVQRDSIRVDVEATLEQVLELTGRRAELAAGEVDFLRESGAELVVADIPAMPLEAAAKLGLPRVAIGNFSWDWIYSPFVERDARWRGVIDLFEEGYRQADLLLKLPFAPEMPVFARQEEVGLLARPGRNRRAELARATGADPAKRWVLLSFTTLEWNDEALRRVEALEGFQFFTVKPLDWPGRRNIHGVAREEFIFSDVLASTDLVVTKPGYGILSDCVANAKPIVYAEREDFIEYPVLERELKRFLKHVHVPAADLYAGRLEAALEAVGSAPEPREVLRGGGAEQVADRLIGLY